MTRNPLQSLLVRSFAITLSALALVAGAGVGARVSAQGASPFPSIRAWAFPGAWQDSTLINPTRCAGSFKGPLADSVRQQPRSLTLRFLRDRRAEARPDFGGYRIYRMTATTDTTRAVLLRRMSINTGGELSSGLDLTWHLSRLDTTSMQYKCNNQTVHDSVVTFVDPDSSGNYQKKCRRRNPLTDQCLSPGDSAFVLVSPAGPHDGFLTWYAITYEKLNTSDTDYEDLFIPDTLDNFARCGDPLNRNTCPNLNSKLRNLVGPVEPTGGPTTDLETVRAVPNPYRGNEVWDQPGNGEVHFINVPTRATIKIYTVAGDLVRQIEHDDSVRDFARWDLRSGAGKEVASGIYIYRIEAGTFSFQNRLVVIR